MNVECRDVIEDENEPYKKVSLGVSRENIHEV